MEFERDLHGIDIFTVHRKTSYYAIDGGIFSLTFVSGLSKLFAVKTYIYIYTHVHRNIFIHICAYVCIQIFSLSLLFNFAMEGHPCLGNRFQIPRLYYTANEYSSLEN